MKIKLNGSGITLNKGKECTQKRWKAGEPFPKHIGLLIKLEKETQNETPENMSNEATRYSCAFCGCDHCGQPILLRECSWCHSTLCECHILPEAHDCSATQFKKNYEEYALMQAMLNGKQRSMHID